MTSLLVLFSTKTQFVNASGEYSVEKTKSNSIVLGLGILPKHHDEKFIPAIELSYMYNINEIFAIGAGVGIHFTQEPFYVVALRGDAGIYKGLGGGILIGTAIQDAKVSGMAGVELGYEFYLKPVYLGPVIELSYHHKHEHFMIGLQVAYPF